MYRRRIQKLGEVCVCVLGGGGTLLQDYSSNVIVLVCVDSLSSLSDVAVFGVPLETAVQRSQLGTDGIELPTVFREFIDFLEEYGELRILLKPTI